MPPAYLRAPPVAVEPPAFLPGCTGKIAQTEADARGTMQRRRGLRWPVEGSVYRCRHCGAWHTTQRVTPLPKGQE